MLRVVEPSSAHPSAINDIPPNDTKHRSNVSISEWSEAVYTENTADVIDRPLVAELQLSPEREADVRLLFKKAAEQPKILIVTDKLLTG